MSPFLSQLLVAAFQALMQALEAKLSHEERVLLLVDPDDLKSDEDHAALERLTLRARLVKHFGREADHREDAP